jgi:hypothetical protein
MKSPVLATLCAVCLSSSLASADGPPAAPAGPPPIPTPAPQLKDLEYFVGKWTCTGTLSMGPAKIPTQATYTLTKELDGFYLAGRFASKKSKDNPHPHVTQDYWSYNVGKKEFRRVNLDNFGDYAQAASPGLQGDTLTFSGTTTFGPAEVKFLESFTKKGAKEMTLSGSVDGPDGKPAVLIDYTCKR